jgi:hypothetical protein
VTPPVPVEAGFAAIRTDGGAGSGPLAIRGAGVRASVDAPVGTVGAGPPVSTGAIADSGLSATPSFGAVSEDGGAAPGPTGLGAGVTVGPAVWAAAGAITTKLTRPIKSVVRTDPPFPAPLGCRRLRMVRHGRGPRAPADR